MRIELQYAQHVAVFGAEYAGVQYTKESLVLMKEGHHWLILHLHAAGLSSCSRLIFFPNQTHQAKPITTHTTDST